MISIRTRLATEVDSALTEQEAERRRIAAEREAWETSGLVLISVDDPKLPWPLRSIIRDIGERRFGRRPANQGDRFGRSNKSASSR